LWFLAPKNQDVVIPLVEGPNSVLPLARVLGILLSDSLISMMHELRDFSLVLAAIVLGIECVIQRKGIFGAIVGFGEIHHAALEIGEGDMVECGLFDSLLDEEVFRFTGVHLG